MKGYNGYRNYNMWNVSLWINNDEGLYNMARDLIKQLRRVGGSREDAAQVMLQNLNDCGITETPDGVPYTVTSIRKAMVGM